MTEGRRLQSKRIGAEFGETVVRVWGKPNGEFQPDQSLPPGIWGKHRRQIGGRICGRIIGPMTVAKNLDAYEQGETQSWAWPVHAFVAWLTTMPGYVTRFKRARRFAPNRRDS